MDYSTYESITMNQNLPLKVIHVDSNSQELLDMGVDITKINYIPRHWHRSLEVTYVLQGAVNLNSLTEKRVVEKDDLLLVNSGIIHEVSNIEDVEVEVICLLISYDFLKEHIPQFDQITFKLNKEKLNLELFKTVFKRILENSKQQDLTSDLKIKSDLFTIISELTKYHVENSEVMVKKDNDFIIEVIEWVHKNYAKPLTLNDASIYFNVSREHFSRTFKQSINETFLQYLYHYRLYCAYADIKNSSKTLEEISVKHGFPNVKSLISRFKDYYGTTPGNFRKENIISIIDHQGANI